MHNIITNTSYEIIQIIFHLQFFHIENCMSIVYRNDGNIYFKLYLIFCIS